MDIDDHGCWKSQSCTQSTPETAGDGFPSITASQPLATVVVWSIFGWEKYQADALAAGVSACVL